MTDTRPLLIDYRQIGGIRFIRLGRFFVSFGVSREYRPIGLRKKPVDSYPQTGHMSLEGFRKGDC